MALDTFFTNWDGNFVPWEYFPLFIAILFIVLWEIRIAMNKKKVLGEYI